jgi:hypothetical protein
MNVTGFGDRHLHARSLELAAAAVDFDLTSAETAELEAHLAGCSTCSRRAAAMRRDALAIGRSVTLATSPRVDAAIYAEIAGHRARPQNFVLIAATAALLLLALLGASGIGAYLLRTWELLPNTIVPPVQPPALLVSPPPDDSPLAIGDALLDAPRVVYWNMSGADRIAVATSQSVRHEVPGPMFELDMWPDPDQSAVTRLLLASPTGKHVAVAETDRRAVTRIRIATSKGAIVWSTQSANGVPALAWSADGSQLAVAFAPKLWLVVAFPAGSPPKASEYSELASVPLRLLGFSADGLSLLAYDGSGKAAPWERPYSIDLARRTATRLDRFPGGASGIAVSNTTTFSGRVDTVTGRVLDSGDASAPQTNWTLRHGSDSIELGVPTSNAAANIQPGWAEDGSIVVLETSLDDGPPSNDQKGSTLGLIRRPAPGARVAGVVRVIWSYIGPFGTRSRADLLGVRNGWALAGEYAIPSRSDAWLGYDQIALGKPGTSRGAVTNLNEFHKRDIHVAGLVP